MLRYNRFVCPALVVLAFFSQALAQPASVSPSAARPNIVLIVADDLGYSDLGYQGSKDISTPHIDAIARAGTSFANAYITAPVCMPSRMGMLTGRYQQRFGMQTLGNDGLGIPAGEVNLGEMLRTCGYATGIIGKWHLGTQPEFRPSARGFDEFYGFLNGNIPYFPAGGKGFWRNREAVAKPAYTTDAFGDEAVAFIDRHAAHPFFLYLSFNAVHTPMQATPRYVERFAKIPDEGRRIYAAMAAAMDDNVGRVMEALRKKGVEENTLVIFLSDNGGAPQNYSDNSPLRAGKYEMYEGGIRTPFYVQWRAGGVPVKQERAAVVSALDIVPTILAAVNAKVELKKPLDGFNLLPFLRGQKSTVTPDRRLYWRYGPYMCAMREGDWKILKCGMGENKNPVWELYNIAADLSEKTDLAAKYPERLRQLTAAFDLWDQTLPPGTVIDQRLLDGKIWWKTPAALNETKD